MSRSAIVAAPPAPTRCRTRAGRVADRARERATGTLTGVGWLESREDAHACGGTSCSPVSTSWNAWTTPTSKSRSSPKTAATCVPAPASRAGRAHASTGTTTRRRPSPTARSRSWWSARCRSPYPRLGSRASRGPSGRRRRGCTETRRGRCAASESPARRERARPRHCSRGSRERPASTTGLIGNDGVFVDGVALAVEKWGGTNMPQADQLQYLLAQMRDDGVRTVAMEVTSRALDVGRVDATWFAAACFTNLSHEHLDDHGSLEAYFQAKLELFDPARVANVATNIDDPYGARVRDRATSLGLDVWTYAVDDGARRHRRHRGGARRPWHRADRSSTVVRVSTPASSRSSSARSTSRTFSPPPPRHVPAGFAHGRGDGRDPARRRPRPGRTGRRGTAVRGARRLRARPGELDAVLAAARALAGGAGARAAGARKGHRRLRLRWRPRSLEASAHGCRCRPGLRRRGAHVGQPTVGGSAGDRRRGAPRAPRRAAPTSWSNSTAAPRSATRSAPPAPGTWS